MRGMLWSMSISGCALSGQCYFEDMKNAANKTVDTASAEKALYGNARSSYQPALNNPHIALGSMTDAELDAAHEAYLDDLANA